MQNAFLKLALMATLSISSAFAAESDLLSQATSGAISTAKADVSEVKVLSQDEMKDVKGGATIYVPMRLSSYPTYLQRLSAYIRVK